MKLKLGIIGVGNIASAHIGNVLEGRCPEIEITALADRKESRREWARERIPTAAIFAEGTELIHSGTCEAVLIAVPHYQHPTLAIEAFRAGLHVMCEKPAGVYTLQVREMDTEADRHPELTFGMMFNQRTNCVYRKMKEMLDAGELGEIKRVNWIVTDWYRTQFYYDSGAWRATWSGEGGGVLLNQCPHQLDLLQWLCGLPVRVHAFCHEGKWHDIEVEDDVTAYMEFANGATGVFITTTGDAPGTNRLEITLDRAKLVCENDSIRAYILDESMTEFSRTAEEGFAKPGGHWEDIDYVDTDTEQHVAVTNAFAAHILHGTPLIARGEEGINGLTISNAAHLSSWLGRKITLPIDEDLFYEELQKKIASSCGKKEPVKEVVVEDMSSTYGS